MSVFFRLNKNNNQKIEESYGKWYAKAVVTGTVTTEDLSEVIQRNCSMKRSDVNAVLTELVEVMQDNLQSSKRVKIDGLGTFKMGIMSRGAETAAAFDIRKHVKGLRVNFFPEVHIDANGLRTKTLIMGATVKELPKNAVDTKKSDNEEGGEG